MLQFKGNLTIAERELFRDPGGGDPVRFEKANVDSAGNWGRDRTIRASCIQWLCTDKRAVSNILPHKGVRVEAALITGALLLSDVRLRFPLIIRRCAIPDWIELERAHLPFLDLEGTHVGRDSLSRGPSIRAAGMEIRHSLTLGHGFYADGEVDLSGATVGGDLDCRLGHLRNIGGDALSADGISVRGGVYLSAGFVAEGRVGLLGATVGGSLQCDSARFVNANGAAMNANRAVVNGSVFFRNKVYLEGNVNLAAATVGGMFQWRGVSRPQHCTLDMATASIGTLWDEEMSWPARVQLDGLVYKRIYKDAPLGARQRLSWLRRQGEGEYLPQPYKQLASVLEELGHEDAAQEILVAMNEDPARLALMSSWERWGHRVLGWTIGYGYMPLRAVLWIVAFVVVGCVVFGSAYRAGRLKDVGDKNSLPGFNALVYAIDTFVPIIDLDQGQHRRPDTRLLRAWWWLYTACGWAFATILAIGLSGLVRE